MTRDNNKREKYKLGYTTGVFDLFHVGHLRLLLKAKSLCDKLIVGVDSDDKVRKDKGDRRPINTLEDRITILKSIKYKRL